MAISKQAISSQIKATIRNIQVDGEDHVDTFVDIIVNAIIDELWANGEFKGMVTGGGCTHSGTHPPVPVEGKIY